MTQPLPARNLPRVKPGDPLSADQMNAVIDMCNALLQAINDLQYNDNNIHQRNYAFYIAKSPAGGIAARSGDTLTSQNCDLYGIVDDELNAIIDSGSEPHVRKVYNLSTTAIDGSAYLQIRRENATSQFLAVWEDC